MLLLTNFTNSPNQEASITLPDNSTFIIRLEYDSLVQSWFYDIIYTSANFNYLGKILLTNLNLLNGFVNILNFGILCETIGGGDPYFLNDFSTGRVNLYLLNATEIVSISNTLNGV